MMEYRLPPEPILTSFESQMFPKVYSSENTEYLKFRPQMLFDFNNTNTWGGMLIDSVLLDNSNLIQHFNYKYTKGWLIPEDNGPINGKTVKVYFKTYLPRDGDRLSFTDDEYVLGSWFPMPAILKNDGNWYNPHYGAFSEPIGDYFLYEVDLVVPNYLKVAAAGSSGQSDINDTLMNLHYSFGPVFDFALAISPYYLIDSTDYNGIVVRIYYRDYEKPIIDRIRTAVLNTLEYMEKYVGQYAYDNLTYAMVSGVSVGGVEYPGFVFLNTPQGSSMTTRFYESMVVHETIHQWFYGMVASDQVESPWMDESITNFFTQKIMAEYWGSEANLFDFAGMKFSERDNLRTLIKTVSPVNAIGSPTYSFTSETDYFTTIYSKGALALETFDNLLGDSLSPVFWQLYFELYRFKHPTQDDFLNLVNEIAGEDISDNMEILISHPDEIDYSVSNIKNKEIDSANYEISFEIERRGELTIPIDYDIVLYNNDTISGCWTPTYDCERIINTTSSAASAVMVDPDNRIAIDANLLNNSISLKSDNGAGLRLSSGLMFLIESFFSFIGGM